MNVERAVYQHVRDRLSPVIVYTTTPATVPAAYVTVERVGGVGAAIDREIDIEVSVTAGTRGAMWDLATAVEKVFKALATDTAAGVYIDDVAERFGFAADPPHAPDRYRSRATYTVTIRPN